MKKMFVIFGMIFFIYATMSIISGDTNPLLWIHPHNGVGMWRFYIFFVEIVFFCMACFALYTDD